MRKTHTSARGQSIDFDLLQRENGKTIAIGNVPMNANGDRLGPGGKIIQKVSDVPLENRSNTTGGYNTKNPKSMKIASLKDNVDDLAATMKTTNPNSLKIEEAKTPSEVFARSTEKAKTEEKVEEKTEETSKSKRKIIDSED
jgi:hypothetical protein